MTNKESLSERLDRLIRNNKVAVLATLVVHAFFMMGLVLYQVTKENPLKENEIFFDLVEETLIPQEMLQQEDHSNGNENADLKNIAVNEGDNNRSSDDYYKEFQDIVGQNKGRSVFQAENYDDKRWLIKDYSKESEYIYKEEQDKNPENQTVNNKQSNNTYAGKTIISYNLNGRKATKLPIPSYQCMGSGEVIVDIIVNQKGNVTSAVVRNFTTPTGEACLPEAATNAALRSRFSIDLKASQQHKGYITYKFVAQ